jgi:hypothetical protein
MSGQQSLTACATHSFPVIASMVGILFLLRPDNGFERAFDPTNTASFAIAVINPDPAVCLFNRIYRAILQASPAVLAFCLINYRPKRSPGSGI